MGIWPRWIVSTWVSSGFGFEFGFGFGGSGSGSGYREHLDVVGQCHVFDAGARLLAGDGDLDNISTRVVLQQHDCRLRRRDEAVEKGMKKLAQKGPQYILYALSVKPAHQGKGVARALVNALFACADSDQVPTYVDCVGERLVKLYSHLGFEKHAEAEVVDPTKQEGGEEKIVMTSLMRKPAPPP